MIGIVGTITIVTLTLCAVARAYDSGYRHGQRDAQNGEWADWIEK